jgi:outer membrane protein assembly factor BamB
LKIQADGRVSIPRYYNGVPGTRTTISCVLAAILAGQAVGFPAAQHVLTFPLESRWSSTLAAPPAFPPAYDTGRAFVPLQNRQVSAVSLADGQSTWSLDWNVTSPPAAGESLVFAAVGDSIEARSQGDGRLRWQAPVDAPIAGPLHWDSGWLVASVEPTSVLALRASDGGRLWQSDIGARLQAPPALAGDRLYLALQDGRLIAVELQTGKLLWTRAFSEPVTGILPLEDRLFAGSRDNFFYCLAAEDGTTRWMQRTGADIAGTPVIDERHVYFVALDNMLRALDRWGGSLRWHRQLPFRPSTGPLLSGDLLIVTGIAAELRGYLASTGMPAGELALRTDEGNEMQLAAPPALAEGVPAPPIILTRDGRFQGLGPAPPPPSPDAPIDAPQPPAVP